MPRMNCTLALCALAVALTGGPVAAQQTPPPKPTAKVEQKTGAIEGRGRRLFGIRPRRWDPEKEWDVATEKMGAGKSEVGTTRNRQSRKEKLEVPKSWSFIASCMTKT